MEFKNKERKKSVTASLIKRLHSRITGSGADFLLSSSHDFLQFRAAADVLKHKQDRTRRLPGWAACRAHAQTSSGYESFVLFF